MDCIKHFIIEHKFTLNRLYLRNIKMKEMKYMKYMKYMKNMKEMKNT